MALFTYRVNYGNTYNNATVTASDVQSVTMNIGRQRQLDPYNADTATVVMRYPNGYASPNASWITGTWIRIAGNLTGTVPYGELFVGRVSDVSVQYGIPYVGSVGNADFVTLTCEGNFAALGRLQGNNYGMSSATWESQTSTLFAQTGISCQAQAQYGGAVQMAATTISGTWGDWVNRTLLTANGRMTSTQDTLTLFGPNYRGFANDGNFSDTTNDASNHAYHQIQFSGYADNYYTQVTVAPESYSSATVQTGSTPYRTYVVNTLNASTAQATDYANYLLGNYKSPVVAITSITCSLNAQVARYAAYGAGYVGTQVSVAFRGTTYQCIIEGSTWSGTPESSSVTFYLSGADLNAYLLLDNAVYGKLDSNKLGY